MIVAEGKYYLYRHIRLDKNEVFNVGIGTKISPYKNRFSSYRDEFKRAFDRTNRSKYWENIVKKAGYEVEVLLQSDDYEFIKQKEIEFVALYGRKNLGLGTLCNLTDGGDGTLGAIPKNKKKVYQFTKTGEFIKEWESITEVSKVFDIHRALVTRTLKYNQRGRCRTITGFIFQYTKEFISKNKDEYKNSYSHRNKKVALYHENGSFIKQWNSLNDCVEDLGTFAATVRKNINGSLIDGSVVKKFHRFKYI